MKNLIGLVLLGVIMFVVVVGIIILIGVALHYVLQFVPCEIMVYVETGILLGLFMLIAYMAISGDVSLFAKKKNLQE